MPVRMPAIPPPLSHLSSSMANMKISLQDAPTSQNESPNQNSSEISAIPRIPRVRVDVEVIPDMMAAKLATSLLGHILFLKSQIPLPVLQLARMPVSEKSNSRATKVKRDLIDSFDTLSSHLDTTFTALSTAFARCSNFSNSVSDRKPSSQVYMAILIGPSVGTAKSKIIFAVDGLETKIWGLRDDSLQNVKPGEEESDSEEQDSETEEADESFEEEESSEPEYSDSDLENANDTSRLSPPPSTALTQTPVMSSSVQDHALEQQRIRAADQLLSRTLAAADAAGYGMASELAPTQTHILLRAPRRFSHPAWMPRPNSTNSMEHTLKDFLEETRLFIDTSPDFDPDSKSKSKRMTPKQKQKIEGVWVVGNTPSVSSVTATPLTSEENTVEDEADEMIWWSWDGKIVGFSSW